MPFCEILREIWRSVLEPEVTDTRNSEKPNVLEISGDVFIVGSVFHCEFTALDIEDLLGVQDVASFYTQFRLEAFVLYGEDLRAAHARRGLGSRPTIPRL